MATYGKKALDVLGYTSMSDTSSNVQSYWECTEQPWTGGHTYNEGALQSQFHAVLCLRYPSQTEVGASDPGSAGLLTD